ncbi:hypothetical protein [Mycolicibacterium helvum]|uniref:Uncharacterized protein n=1 Tax=Mycolicibacterium helvum TaxID=1534349 RepID=A0A7I7TEW1_9MYCO|nr:hypothetical protein [Mycolicibacterium helvum]BBY67757.1 hypothetical protein MHEL_60000 [Mycolicibacterium helvum]
MTVNTATEASPFHDFWLTDYCPGCNPLGHNADSRTRAATLTEPDAVTWHGGKALICDYFCVACGNQRTRADLWTAKAAGIKPPKTRKVA